MSAQEEILCLGLNCHYITKPRPTGKRMEIVLLLDTVQENECKGARRTTDALQPLLLGEALTDRGQYWSRIIRKEMGDAAKALRMQKGFTVHRADKIAAFILINTKEYHEKLERILADTTKFESSSQNPTEDIKSKANRIIQTINAATNAVHMSHISSNSVRGYLYSDIKTIMQGNPIQLIISQCPTPTYHLAKRLNALLTPCILNKYCLRSSAEFLKKTAFIDVESLFTNVPVSEKKDFIMDRVYRDKTTHTLNVPEASLRAVLAICTKKAPFTTPNGHMYIQKDGIAMGSPLGILFANFYMGIEEERVFLKKSVNHTSM
ncbi:uncharacterized protein [Palaemon carinicauda]|uniref:uncharacterized protein n=1 Tax=Palaemon carinicauda TaxID=392227 RepID=UPI0035B66B31